MTTRITRLRAELRTDSTDVAVGAPRLSWITESDTEGWTQASAELELDGAVTASIDGRDQVLVEWPFEPLAARSRHIVRVRVTGADGDASDWSEGLEVVAGFLDDGSWIAQPIGLGEPSRPAQPALLRKTFEVQRPVARATLYATARGVYQASVNGHAVDDQELKPGWTPYGERLLHETTDVTDLVTPGTNVIGITLGGAWYTERFGFSETSTPFYGEQPDVAVQLVLDYQDGGSEVIASGPDWRATGDGPVVNSSLYDGEEYDARLEIPEWGSADFDDGHWPAVRVSELPMPVPGARIAPAVRATQELAVAEVVSSPSGGQILDFGQNLVGRLRITVDGEAGTVVTLRHAEVLEHGELGIRPLRLAKATDVYTLRGGGPEVWEPRFTFHGFRYAEITGLPEPIAPDAVTAVVLHSDMRRTGWFESSDPLLNRLHENVVWGMRGNFLSVPTDCPQRDERLGWTGDIQVFTPTASFLYDVDGFLSSWLVDLAIEQQKTGVGSVPFVVPNVLRDADTPAAAWGDAATVVPSVLYERYADAGMLSRQFDSMKAWADHLLALAGDRKLWEGGFQFGDWLDPSAPPDNAFLAKTDPDLVASAYLFRSVQLVARAARVLGRESEAEHYEREERLVRDAFIAEYVTASGRIVSDAQTAYATAIIFGIFASQEQRDAMGARLAELVRSGGYHIGTGFVGTPLVTEALETTGQGDTAERLLLQTENPSWLYPVTMGATTIWERWDSMLEDGSINPGEMTSFNHYALGGVADWMHRSVAGLAPAAPGYRVIRIAPRPLDGLESASATLDTPYGRVSVAWRREGAEIVVDATVPANATAEVALPGSDETILVGSGSRTWRVPAQRLSPQRVPVSRTIELSELIQDRMAYDAIGASIENLDADRAQRWRRNTRWVSGLTLADSLGTIPLAVSAAIDDAVREVNASR
ncbi:family 78 glycoside hydrolase catalytic domain [Microbacterium sp. EST19A]|uniref:family 78 glycoside hydrolase catalytic domain n=1 Tax=Microbacterium sp. EST19A TaxID=2862681 RepID=UPI001CBB5147|nr:family 78 glycoside hydrolase catalytic domain [Microbacterium sp. EST19A]